MGFFELWAFLGHLGLAFGVSTKSPEDLAVLRGGEGDSFELSILTQRKLFAKSSEVALATTLVFWKVLFSPFSMRMRS